MKQVSSCCALRCAVLISCRTATQEELVLELPSATPWSPRAVTLVTQFSVSRLSRFERTVRTYKGPLSIAIYLTDEADINILESYLTADTLARWAGIAIAVVKPDYSVQQDALIKRLRYPINCLRNIALSLAPTQYVFVTDADFVPSPEMHAVLESRGVPLITDSPTTPKHQSPTLKRTAVVLSAFALAPNYTGPYPSTAEELYSALYGSNPPRASLTDRNAGHGPSQPSLLFPRPFIPFALPSLHNPPPTLPHWSYSICYEPQWEPYYLLHRPSHPVYDERFTDQGGDKQSHALLLNALGFEFRALRDVWLVHPPKVGSEEDALDEAWPSARLVDPSLDERGVVDEGEKDTDHDPAHFNSRAQRDERRFRYFQDFLPEMERTWGANVRWPTGCGARDVARAGGGNFGRQRAQAVFGV